MRFDCCVSTPSALTGEPIEARLLLVAERTVEAIECRLHGIERVQRGLEPLLHRGDATGRGHVLVALAARLEILGGFACCLAERLERGRLLLGRLDRPP